jgi:hypothetical protein
MIAREDCSLLASIEDIPHWQQGRIDRIVYFLRCIALGPPRQNYLVVAIVCGLSLFGNPEEAVKLNIKLQQCGML